MLTAIVAHDKNRGIAKNGRIPWKNREDMEHFRDTTRGGAVIMGRRTWESIPDQFKPLSDRVNIVLSETRKYPLDKALTVDNLQDALILADQICLWSDISDVFIIGGVSVYEASQRFVDRVIVTEIDADYDCDQFFYFSLKEFSLKETTKLTDSVCVKTYLRK